MADAAYKIVISGPSYCDLQVACTSPDGCKGKVRSVSMAKMCTMASQILRLYWLATQYRLEAYHLITSAG